MAKEESPKLRPQMENTAPIEGPKRNPREKAIPIAAWWSKYSREGEMEARELVKGRIQTNTVRSITLHSYSNNMSDNVVSHSNYPPTLTFWVKDQFSDPPPNSPNLPFPLSVSPVW